VTTNITQRTGANGLQSAFAASSAATFSISTADPSLSTTLAPVLTVMLGFGRHAGLQAVPRGPSIPQRRPDPPQVADRPADAVETESDAPHPSDAEAGSAGVTEAENGPPEVAGTESGSPEASATESDRTELLAENGSASEDSEAEPASESGAARQRGERRLRHADAAAESSESGPAAADTEAMSSAEPAGEAEATAEAQPDEPKAELPAAKPAPSNRLEMTIDSLPHHDLTAPIPIYIDPLGDAVFTATVANLDIMATGNSIGEALLLLKEQIEFIYGDLNRRHKLSPEQTTMLKMLHTYIAPKGTKPSWL